MDFPDAREKKINKKQHAFSSGLAPLYRPHNWARVSSSSESGDHAGLSSSLPECL